MGQYKQMQNVLLHLFLLKTSPTKKQHKSERLFLTENCTHQKKKKYYALSSASVTANCLG